MTRLWIVLLGVALVCGCAEPKKEAPKKVPEQKTEAKSEAGDNSPPLGTWYLYAGSETGYRTDKIDQEVTILVLGDSTYTLTYMQPKVHLNFVEKGKVDYDVRNQQAKFSVYSSAGVDFSGAEPRKLVDVDQVVPWQRDPGTVYVMGWRMDKQFDDKSQVEREVMVLSAENTETSYFVRFQHQDAGAPILDAHMSKKDKQ